MPPTPSPHDTVPDFIVERFADHSIEELREIARYAETLDQSENVPDYIVRAFAIQDDETRTVVAIYADELADSLEASNRGGRRGRIGRQRRRHETRQNGRDVFRLSRAITG